MFGDRLKRARIKAGFSMQDLVDNAQNIVTKQAISQYEKDQKSPSSTVLIALANALGVGVEYFFRTVEVKINKVDFRKHSSLGVKKQETIKEKVQEYLERYLQIENILEINAKFDNPIANDPVNDFDDLEQLALNLRSSWNLGIDSIDNIIEMLELQNIKVILIEDEKHFNGLSGEANEDKNHPFVVLNNSNELTADRKRFTAIHELAHLVLPQHELNAEKASDRFSGAFLFPKDSVFSEFGEKRTKISLEELNHVKQKYGISIAGIVFRLYHLDIIGEAMFNRFWIKNRTDKFDEKFPYKKPMKTARFENLLGHAYSEELISLSKLAELSGLNVDAALKKYGKVV